LETGDNSLITDGEKTKKCNFALLQEKVARPSHNINPECVKKCHFQNISHQKRRKISLRFIFIVINGMNLTKYTGIECFVVFSSGLPGLHYAECPEMEL
jgi:hypothetical protein